MVPFRLGSSVLGPGISGLLCGRLSREPAAGALGEPPEGPAGAARGSAPGVPPEGGVLGAEPLEPKNNLVSPSPRLSALILLNPCEFAASGRSIYRGLRRPSSLGAGVFISGRLGICPTPGRGPPVAGALRPPWRPRAMVEPAGKSVRRDWTDLALKPLHKSSGKNKRKTKRGATPAPRTAYLMNLAALRF